MICTSLLSLILLNYVTAENCPCGWKVEETGEVYTHQMFEDFSSTPDVQNLLKDPRAQHLMHDWMIYDFWQNSDNPKIRLNTKFDAQNVQIKHGELILQQNAYTDLDRQLFNPVHIAGMQTRATDILHGTFRAEMKIEGYTGGSCASFFWYHDDAQELDIEFVTPGTSIVNDTINYTTQPSVNADGSRIPNATLSFPLEHTLDTFKTHRFDCDATTGANYYLDDKLVHTDHHNIPGEGGSLQLKLWADGNRWWSGSPSTTNTYLRIKSVIAYYNTTTSLTNQEWYKRCAREKKQCRATARIGSKEKPASVSCPQSPHRTCEVSDQSTSTTASRLSPIVSYTGIIMPLPSQIQFESAGNKRFQSLNLCHKHPGHWFLMLECLLLAFVVLMATLA